MQTTEQGDGRFFHEGHPMCTSTRILNQLVWFGNTLSFCSTPLCLWRRGLLLEQSSPQMGLPTPKGTTQLGSCLICYAPLSIIRISSLHGESLEHSSPPPATCCSTTGLSASTRGFLTEWYPPLPILPFPWLTPVMDMDALGWKRDISTGTSLWRQVALPKAP